MSYTPTYKRPYEQWKELPSKETLVTAEVLTQYDDTFEHIEEYLESEGEKEYALVTEAGYSIVASIDKYYVLTVVLKNKAGDVLSTSEPIDLPIESMIINVDYDEESGILTFSLQNGQTLDVNISTLVRGLVPTSRKIAGVDLEDDITAEELKTALGVFDSTVTAGELKPWLNSHEEIEAGIWIDGKPLYQTVINFSVPETSGDFITNQIDISNLNADTIIVSHASFSHKDGDYLRWYVIPYITNSGEQVKITTSQKDNDYLLVISNSATFSNDMGYAILNYTKTTDAEGSGNNLNPYGIYDAKLDEVKADIEELQNAIVTTDSTTLSNSHAGRVKFNNIVGGMEQDSTEGNQLFDVSTEILGSTIIVSTGTQSANSAWNLSDFISVLPLTDYCVSQSTGVYFQFKIMFYDESQTYISGLTKGDSSITEYSFTTPENTAFVRISYSTVVNDSAVDRGNIMFNLGTTALPWEPFTNGASPNPDYPQPINGSVISKIRVHNGASDSSYQSKEISLSQPITLYNDVLGENVERKYAKKVYDGTETSWNREVTKTGFVRFYRAISNAMNISTRTKIFVSHFHFSENANADEYGVYVFANGKIHFYMNLETVEEWCEWLVNNNVEVIYPLAESVIEELPTADKIALNSLPTFNGVTYVEFVDVGVQPSVSIDYGTSKVGGMTLESLLTARNNDLRLSSLEASVVNNI